MGRATSYRLWRFEILRPKCATEFVVQLGRLHIVVTWFKKEAMGDAGE